MAPPTLPEKIGGRHRDRLAVVYVRQSTLQQVGRHPESTRLQYALAERAGQLGWARERVVVIDDDLGRSGASAEVRPGFQRLVAEVGLGRVGLVLGVEMSRLARSCRDWHQLLEIRALFDTLIADSDGVYDPAAYNDRLLLGLKGTMSEAELHILKGRMDAGRRAKAGRGELFFNLPRGYVRRPSGEVALDPDEQVRATVRLVFDLFERRRTINGVLVYLAAHDVRLPAVPAARRPGQGRARLAPPEPAHARRDADQPGLRRRLRLRSARDRPPPPASGAPRVRAGRGRARRHGAAPGPPARLHQLGGPRAELRAGDREPCPARGRAARRPLAAGGAARVRPPRPAHGDPPPPRRTPPALRPRARGGRPPRPPPPLPGRPPAGTAGRRGGSG